MEQIAFQTKRGDDFSIYLTFKDASDAVVDITGWTIFFTIKENISDVDDGAILMKDITSHVNPTQGLALISLSNTETSVLLGTYHFDIQYKDNTGKVITVSEGIITFDEDITRRVA